MLVTWAVIPQVKRAAWWTTPPVMEEGGLSLKGALLGAWRQWSQDNPTTHLEQGTCLLSPQLPAPTSMTYHQTYPKSRSTTLKVSRLYFETNKWKSKVLT